MSDKANQLAASIEQIAAKPTERKLPNGQQQNTPIAPNSEATFFNAGQSKPVPEHVESAANPAAATGNQTPPVNLSEKVIHDSGKTGAFLAAGAIETVFGLAERLVFIKKFTSDEKEQLLTVLEKPDAELTQGERSLNYKFLAVSKRHEKMRDKIPLDENETAALEHAFAEHTRITGKSLNPQLILWGTVIKVLTSRSIEIFL